jgi:hypothetical protein
MTLVSRQWLARLNTLDAAGQAAPDWVTGLIERPDGNILLLGFSISSDKIARPFLAQISSNGDIAWQRYTSDHDYKSASGQQVFGMTTLENGEILSAGYEYGSYNGTGEDQYKIPLSINPAPSSEMGGPSRPGIWDGVLTWHDSNGIPIRRRWIGSERLEQLNGVAIGPAGTIFVAGWSDGVVSGVSAGAIDLFIQAISPAGSTLWSKQLGGSGRDRPTALASTVDGGIVVAGHTESSFAGLTNAGNEDAFLIRFDANGDILWARSIATPGPDHAYGVYVLPDDDVLVTGRMAGSDWTPTSGDPGDAFLARYDANGNLRWLQRFGSSAYEYGRSIAVTITGDIIVSGRSEGNFQGLINQGGFDGFVSRFSADGNHQASKLYGTGGNDVVNQLLILSNGDLVVAGMSEGNFENFGNTSGSYDLFVERVSFTSDNGSIDHSFSTIESKGNTSLLQRADNAPFVDIAGSRLAVSSPWGTPVGSTSSQWQMLAAETINGVNQILFRNNTGNFLHTWTLDSNWAWTNSFGAISPSSAQGWDLESSFQVDANNDGFIGAPFSTIESKGNTSLLQRADNAPFVDIAGSRLAVSSPWGTPVGSTSSQWQMLAAETINGVNQILFRNNTGNFLHTWTLDSNWAWTNSFGAISPSSAQGWDLESSFQVDANNDGFIGAPFSGTPGTIGLLTQSLELDEGNSGLTPFSFTIQRSGNLSQTSSVDWAVQGAGVNPADPWDFEGDRFPSGTIVFAPGESSRTITVNVRGDSSLETDERFQLTLSNAAGASLDPQALTAEGLVRNDDTGTWIYDWANAQLLGDTPGVLVATLTRDSFRPGEQPLRLTALRIDLSTPGLSLSSTGPISDWQADSRETLTQTTRDFVTSSRQDGVPVVAAINTAFFNLTNDSQAVPTNLLGFAVSGGELVSPSQAPYPYFVQDPITGARLVREPTNAPDPSDVNVAFAGMANGIVLWDGLVTGPAEPADPVLNARSGLGMSRDNRFLTLLTVDRSLRSFSGPTFWGAGIRDVGTLLSGFGSYSGMNLDGGGSTAMAWWNPTSQSTQLLNAPLFGLERHVGSNLGIVYQQP